MSELEASLGTLGLQEYSKPLVSHGFKTWKDVINISEDSLADLGFKLGHRRKLQREIASYEGKPYSQPLIRVPIDTSLDEAIHPPQLSPKKKKMEPQQSMRPKRKYRPRRPKDPYAPVRPKSDYVLFANYLRESPSVSELNFVEISRLVGKQWQSLAPDERAMWSSFAAQQKNEYEIVLAIYKKTEHYKEYQRRLRARKSEKPEIRDKKILGSSQEQMECALPTFDASDSKDPTAVINKDFWRESSMTMSPSEEQQHRTLPGETAVCPSTRSGTENDFYQHSDYSDDQEMIISLYGESPMAASCDRNDTMPNQPMPDSGYGSVGTEAVPGNADDGAQSRRSFHIQALNPFHMVPCMSVWPYVETFLQEVNNHYYIIDADKMLHQFDLAIAPTARLPNHTMSTLCICISIGCQLNKEGSDEMAIMWYENGRRYLDSDDWGYSLNVMRAMALISIFHRNERPTTARHYLDTALRIGEVNNLPIMTSSDYLVENTPSHEWVLLWSTIRTMASGR